MLAVIMFIKLAIVLVALLVGGLGGFLIGVTMKDTADAEETLDVAESWRKLNLACGDGSQHPDACCAVAGLRAAGYHVEKSGSERGGFCYIKIIQPGKKEQ